MENDCIYALVRDGNVRWNVIYMMIEWVIKLWDAIDTYSYQLTKSKDLIDKNIQLDILQLEDWDILIQFWAILKPFYRAIKRSEGNAIDGIHRPLWKFVPVLEILLYGLNNWVQRLACDIGY